LTTNLEHENVVDDIGWRDVEGEYEGLVPDGRVGGRTDVGLFELTADGDAADGADVVASQLTAFHHAHPQLHTPTLSRSTVVHILYNFCITQKCQIAKKILPGTDYK